MKNVIIVGLTDKHSYKIIDQLENNPMCGSVRRMYTSFQFFREYNKGDADIVLMDNIPDTYPLDFGKKLRDMDSKVLIIRLFDAIDDKLDRLFKDSVSNTASISKIKDNSDYFARMLSSGEDASSSASKWQNDVAPKATGASSAMDKVAGKTVLVVDDFENTLNVIKHSLERVGFNVIPATSAREALQILSRRDAPDVIITDLNMPQMDGFGLIEQLRTMPALVKVPVFILTTEFSLSKKIRAKELGISGWIQKPYKTEEFVQIIANSLE